MRCNKCGRVITNDSSFCSLCGSTVTPDGNINSSKVQDTYNIYDFDKLHPNFKKLVIKVLVFWTLVLFCVVCISKFSIISIVLLLIFSVILAMNLKVNKKKKMIIFGDDCMRISWNSISSTVEETVSVPEISKIVLGTYPQGRAPKYTIEVYTIKKKIKFNITMAQNMEIAEYFELFCKLHGIELDQNS
jgi:hypothetical protein